jgi:tetratricopeptide (TPR) repeat protein
MKRLLLLLCLLALLASVCRAEPPALRITSPHFTLITDAGDHQGRQILDNFEHMRWMFQTLFSSLKVDPAEPIVIVAVRNKKEFQSLEPADYLAKGQLNLAGYFLSSSDKHYILLRLDIEGPHPYATVLHEYTHLQFRAAGEWMPIWLNEGLAEFYQNTEFKEKQVLVGEPSTDDILFLRQNSLIPLATLFRVDHSSPYYHDENKGSIFYAESWALTHYLQITDRQKGTQRLVDYARRMSRHEDPVAAAEAAFGDLKALQRELDGYVRAQRYMQFVLNAASAPVNSAKFQVTPLSPAEFATQRADVLAHIGRTDEARAQLEALATSAPTLPAIYESLGFLAWRSGDSAAALKNYVQAIQLGSANFFTYFNTANLLQSSSDSQDTVIADLLRATELNPTFAPAFDELAQCYTRDDKLDLAVTASIRAIQLDPSSFYYRLHHGDLELRRDQLDSAESVFKAAQTFASTSGETDMIDSRLARIAAMRSSVRVVSTAADKPPEAAQPIVLTADTPPRHADTPATGPRHTVVGVMDKAECSYPAVLDLEVSPQGSAAPLHLYAGNFTKIALTSDSARTADELNPCADFNGRTAKIAYAESADKTADGQIVSIELRR